MEPLTPPPEPSQSTPQRGRDRRDGPALDADAGPVQLGGPAAAPHGRGSHRPAARRGGGVRRGRGRPAGRSRLPHGADRSGPCRPQPGRRQRPQPPDTAADSGHGGCRALGRWCRESGRRRDAHGDRAARTLARPGPRRHRPPGPTARAPGRRCLPHHPQRSGGCSPQRGRASAAPAGCQLVRGAVAAAAQEAPQALVRGGLRRGLPADAAVHDGRADAARGGLHQGKSAAAGRRRRSSMSAAAMAATP